MADSVSADSKRVTGAKCVSADSKGLKFTVGPRYESLHVRMKAGYFAC